MIIVAIIDRRREQEGRALCRHYGTMLRGGTAGSLKARAYDVAGALTKDMFYANW